MKDEESVHLDRRAELASEFNRCRRLNDDQMAWVWESHSLHPQLPMPGELLAAMFYDK